MVYNWPLLLWWVLTEVLLKLGRAGAITPMLAVYISSGPPLLHIFLFVTEEIGAASKSWRTQTFHNTEIISLPRRNPSHSFIKNICKYCNIQLMHVPNFAAKRLLNCLKFQFGSPFNKRKWWQFSIGMSKSFFHTSTQSTDVDFLLILSLSPIFHSAHLA